MEGSYLLPFERLKVVTMVIITTLKVTELNLAAIFALLPVTRKSFLPGQHLQRKQGKIKFRPEMNVPGEILSMRYKGHVRGIVRSEESKSFPHAIIIDIGTSSRIVSIKLAKTIEITGPPSFEVAQEAVGYLVDMIREAQKNLKIIQEDPEATQRAVQKIGGCQGSKDSDQIENILTKWIHGYPVDQINGFLDFLLSIPGGIYEGNLELGPFESEMINLACELGFPINRVAMAQAMNSEPFITNYNNAQNSRSVKLRYNYEKKDRTTGKLRQGSHTITINISGYVTHSGPNFESMEMVYYSFMKLILENLQTIQSTLPIPRKIKYFRSERVLGIPEYLELLQKEFDLRNRILEGKVPLVSSGSLQSSGPVRSSGSVWSSGLEVLDDQREPEENLITFDYGPILAGIA